MTLAVNKEALRIPALPLDMAPSFETNNEFDSDVLLKNQPIPKRLQNFETKSVVASGLRSKIANIDHDSCEAGDEDSFFVADIGAVVRNYRLWQQELPQVQPHYAVKCNTDMRVIEALARMGCNFDCASKTEIDQVLLLGVDPGRIVYANPCKTNSYVRHAKEVGVNLTTVDNVHELQKIKRFHPECGILIRIMTDDESAQCRLSTKFGCSVKTAVEELFPLAKELNLRVRGVAFHVGLGATDLDSIYKAVQDSRILFDCGIDQFGFKEMNLLDIGGGFQELTFGESSAMVRMSLDKFFSSAYRELHPVEFIAEPGRFMVANAFTLAVHVIARRDVREAESEVQAMLYVNDGVYGNLNCILFDHQVPLASLLTHKGQFVYGSEPDPGFSFSIWGPTCDGLDCISGKCLLAFNVEVGDWLYFPNLGAYTSAATTSFNGFKGTAEVVYVNSEK